MIKKFTDNRGDFMLFDCKKCDQVNIVTNPKAFTFRGLHYQEGDSAQRKTVKVIQGKVLDFLHDPISNDTEIYVLDKDSEPLIVGKEFAHGYLTIEPNTIFTYAVEGDYNPDTEHSIVWKDVDKVKQAVLDFIWTDGGDLTISDKEKNGK